MPAAGTASLVAGLNAGGAVAELVDLGVGFCLLEGSWELVVNFGFDPFLLDHLAVEGVCGNHAALVVAFERDVEETPLPLLLLLHDGLSK